MTGLTVDFGGYDKVDLPPSEIYSGHPEGAESWCPILLRVVHLTTEEAQRARDMRFGAPRVTRRDRPPATEQKDMLLRLLETLRERFTIARGARYEDLCSMKIRLIATTEIVGWTIGRNAHVQTRRLKPDAPANLIEIPSSWMGVPLLVVPDRSRVME